MELLPGKLEGGGVRFFYLGNLRVALLTLSYRFSGTRPQSRSFVFACFNVQARAKYDRAIAGSRTKPTSINRELGVISLVAPVGCLFIVPGWFDWIDEVVPLGLEPEVVGV